MPRTHHAALPAPRRAAVRKRRAPPRRRISRLLAWLLAAWLGSSGWALAQVAPTALPAGAQVKVGAGQLSQNGNLLLIQQSTDKLGLDWQSFNIGSGATVEFRQPGAGSIALNRVLGNSGSQIFGQLKANGQVFLTNPNGVLFAPGARVDVGGLVASTLDLAQQDFAEGRFQFNNRGATGSVLNQGSLRASAGGYLALFGQQVSNQGDISVDAGSVVLASGRAVTVSISGGGLLSAVVAPNTLAGSVDNSGRIAADGGVVTLSAKSAQDIAASLVNNSGIVRANTLVERGGEIWITGDNVALGGTLSAAAPQGGDAGRIMVLADMQRGQLRVAGTIDASSASGRGGFVESSAARVDVAGTARIGTQAPDGKTGTWLIDPNDFTIAPAGGNITGAALGAQLSGGVGVPGTNVVIATATQGTAGGNGDIFANDNVAWSANKLTLRAERNISVNQPLNGSGSASLAFEYGQAAVAAGNTSRYVISAPVSLPAGNNFSTKLGSNGATTTYSVVTTLAGLQAVDSGSLSASVVLGADIDATASGASNGGLGFNPIGNEASTAANTSNSFSGRFDGLGHTISGLTVNRSVASVGLFASTFDADIRNLTLAGGSFTGATLVGSLAGVADGNSRITNIVSSASVNASGANATAVGGLIGRAQGTGSVSSSTASGDVTGSLNVGSVGGIAGEFAMAGGQTGNSAAGLVNRGFYTGGLIGWYNASAAVTDGSYTGATVSGGTWVGGLVGYVNSAVAITGTSPASPLTVSANVVANSNAGGLVGRSNGAVTNARANGNVSGAGNVGGLIGEAAGTGAITSGTATGTVSSSSNSGYVGGLVGYITSGGIVGSSASGAVTGGNETGGLVGYFNNNGSISGSSASGNVTSTAANGEAGGLVGYASGSGAIVNSSASGNVTALANSGGVGGLAGQVQMTGGVVNSSAGSAGSTVAGGTYTGGVVGYYTSAVSLLTDANATVAFRGASVSGAGVTGGLVGYSTNTAELKGLTAAASVTSSSGQAGGLVGRARGSITNSSASGNVIGATDVGGLVGYTDGPSTISGSSASGSVTNTGVNGTTGGLIGNATGGSVLGGSASGNVSGGRYAGGLIGYFSNGSGGNIINGLAQGNVSSNGDAGGLVGFATGNGKIANSLATGSVSTLVLNQYSAGGLAGYFGLSGGLDTVESRGNVGGTAANAGGLVGFYDSPVAITSVAMSAATVSGNSWVGGLIGYINSAAAITGPSANNPFTVTTAVSSVQNAGGLAGRTAGSVSNVRATGAVTSTGANGNVGGLIGQADTGTATLTDVSASGNVNGASSGSTGGLVGYSSGPGVLRGNATGTVGEGSNVGGLVGYFANANSISFARADGNVVGNNNVGGLVGFSSGAGGIFDSQAFGRATNSTSNGGTGGLVGSFQQAGGMARVQASGIVSGGTYTGGLAGYFTSNGALTTAAYLGASVSGSNAVGGLVGYAGTMNLTGGTSAAAVTGSGSYTGGLVGYGSGSGSIVNSTASGAVTGATYVGGLAGWLDGYSINNGRASGKVVGVADTVVAGGLVGQFGYYYNNGQTIRNSGATGEVLADSRGAYLGGLVGQGYYGNIINSTATGKVTGLDSTLSGTSTAYIGGLVGLYSNADIDSSSATGAVTGRYYSGGLAGYFGSGSITKSSASGPVSGTFYSGGLVGYFSGVSIGDSSAQGGVSGGEYLGGLVGYSSNSANLSNVSASGNVNAAGGGSYVGGLIGLQQGAGVTSGFASGTVTASTVAGTRYVGGLIGLASGSVNAAGGVAIDDSAATGSVSGGNYTGGLIGYYTASTAAAGIVNSRATGSVTGSTYTGGLVGYFTGPSNATQDVRNSFASGAVSGLNYVGGLVGAFSGYKGLNGTYATGSVLGRGVNATTYLGGLAGSYFFTNATGATGLSRSYATGDVTHASFTLFASTSVYAGGLVGYLDSNARGNLALSDAYATGKVNVTAINGQLRGGGLVGLANASLARGYATGAVSISGGTARFAGGLVGQANSGVTVTSGFWDLTGTGQASSAGGAGLTPAQLKQAASFTGWSIASDGTGGRTWRIYEGFTTPLLSNFLTPLTLTLADASKTYDGTTSFGNAAISSASGPVTFPNRIFTAAPSPDVGSYNIAAAGVFSVQNGYDLTVAGSATLTVTPRPLTLTGLIADKVYDGTRNATLIGSAQPAGLVAGEDLLVNLANVTATFDTKTVGNNKAVSITGYALADGVKGKASNYSLANATQSSASITPALLTAGGFSATDRVYNGSTLVALTATPNGGLIGKVAGDDVAVDLSLVSSGTMADKNVGSNKTVSVTGVAVTGADAGNYRVAGVDGVTVNITPKTLNVDALSGVNRVYNARLDVQVNTAAAVFSGLLSGDLVSLQSNLIVGNMANKNVGAGKAVTVDSIGLRGPDAANYRGVAGPVTVDITPAQAYLYVTRNGSTDRVYNGSNAANVDVQVLSVYTGDRVTLSNDAPVYSDKNVAYTAGGAVTSKTITAANASIAGTDAANYQLNTTYYGNTTTGTISPKALAVTGVAASNRAYDGTVNVDVNVAGATVDTGGVIPGDVVQVTLPSSGTVVGTVANKNVGTNKPVAVPGFSLTGADRLNYTLTGSNGVTVNISKKDLTATYTGRDRVYDGNTWAGVVVSTADIVAGDAVTFYANDYAALYTAYPYYYTPPAVFTGSGAKNVGNNKPITVNYDYLQGNDAANYRYVNTTLTGNYGSATASVTPKPLSSLVFSGSNKVYDGTVAATVSLNKAGSGIVGSDAVTSAQDASFGDKNVGTGKTITVGNIVLAGADAINYSVVPAPTTTTANITPKPVTFTGITGVDRAYDGSTVVAVNASGVTSQGFVPNDLVAVQQPPGGLTSGTVADKNVGAAKVVTISGLTLTGADAPNYSIDSVGSGTTVNITPKALTAAYTGVNRAYNGGVAAQVTAASADIVAGDNISFGQRAVFTGLNGRDVGSNKPISVTGITLGGSDRGNYALVNTSATTSADITAKLLTLSYTASGRVYNGLADTSINVLGSTADLVAGDLVSFSQTARLRGDGAAGDGKTVDVSGISLGGAQAANYALAGTTATTTVNIAKRPIGVTGIVAVDRAYDGTQIVAINVGNAAVNTASIVAADVGQVTVEVPPSGISSGTVLSKDVGQSKDVQVTGLTVSGAAASNYTVAGATGITVNITPRALTALYTAANKVYDGTATAQVTASSNGILAGDVGALGFSASGAFADGKNAGLGKTVNVSGGFLTGVERNNYALSNPGGTATANITPKTLTPSYLGGSRVYDGSDRAPVTSQTAGVVAGDVVAFGQTAVFSAGKNVGNGKAISISGIVLAGADAANYSLAANSANASGSITPKAITVAGLDAVTASNRVYDGTTTVAVTIPTGVTLTPNSADIVAGDQVNINVPAAGVTTGTMTDKNAGNNKALTITGLTLSGNDAGNYLVAGAAGVTVNIARKDLTAVYTGITRAYDGGLAVNVSGTSADVISGDLLTINGSGLFVGPGAKNVGNGKAIQVNSAVLGGADRINYTLLNTSGGALGGITPRILTPGYAAYSRVYDGTSSASLTATGAGVVAGDDLSFSQTAVFSAGKNVGNGKAISVSGISMSGTDAPNYSLAATSTNASGNITPRPVTLTGLSGVTATDRVYDGTSTVTVNLVTTGTVAPSPGDILGSDNVTVSIPSNNVTTGAMANKNAGPNKAVLTIAGLGLSGPDAANYSLVGTTGLTVNIAAKSLTASYLGGTRVYDGTAAAPVFGSSTDILAGDTVGFNISGVFTGAGAKNVGTVKAIDVLTANLSGSDAANYRLVNSTGSTTGGITPKSVTVAFTGGSRVYDGTASAPVNDSIVGLVTGDVVTSTATALFTGAGAKNVGDSKSVSISGINLLGGDAGNYALSNNSASTTGSITPRPLRVNGLTGITATDRVYDGTSLVAVNVASSGTLSPNSQDLIAGDDVTLNAPPNGATTGTMRDKNAGRNKAVMVAGLTLSGADAPNYSIAATGGLTVNITPRPLTATYVGVTRTYDGSTSAAVLGSTADLIGGDSVGITGSGRFTGGVAKNVGTGKAIDVLGAALSGTDSINYLLTNPTGTANGSITPRLVTVLYTGGSKVYDGTVLAPVSGSVAGFIAGDQVTLGGSAVFTGNGAKNVGENKAVSISGMALAGDDAANYALVNTVATTTASITPRPLRVNGLTGIAATNRTYDGTTVVSVSAQTSGGLTPNQADVIAGDDVSIGLPAGGVSAGTIENKNVGLNKQVKVPGLTLGGADGSNYTVAAIPGLTVNITPRPVNAVYVGIDKVYDGTALAQVGGVSQDLIAGDLISIGGSGVFAAGKNAGIGKTVLVTGGALLGADSTNYTLLNTTANVTATIAPKLLQPLYSGGSRVYDGTAAATVTLGDIGLVAGDDIGVSQNAVFSGGLAAKNVGSGKTVLIDSIALAGADAPNYRLAGTTASTTGSITPRPVNVSGLGNLSAVDRVYDGTRNVQINADGAVGSSASGDFLAGDDVAVNVPSGTLGGGLMVDKNVGSNKSVAIAGLTLSGADAANYRITGTAGVSVNITPKPVALLGLAAVDRVYDGTRSVAIDTSAGSIAGAIVGDDLQLLSSGVTGSMADKHAGSGKAVTVAGLALGGADAANYMAGSAAGLTVNIAKRPFNAALAVADKVYDGTDAANATLTTAGLVSGDQLTLAGGGNIRFADKNVGSGKTVSATGLALTGADANDYLLSSNSASASANITPAALTISFAAPGASGAGGSTLSKVYGETLNFSGSEFTAQGLVLNESVGQVTLTSAGALATAAVAGAPYTLTVSGARGGTFDAANYNLTYRSGTLLVTPRPVTLTGSIVVRYADQPNPSYLGVLSSDGVSVSAGSLVFGDSLLGAVLTAPPESATARGVSVFELVPANARFAAGVNASNYSLRYVSGLLVVLPTPPRVGDTQTGGTVSGVGVEVDQDALERAFAELERNGRLVHEPRALSLPEVQRIAEASAADITVALVGDSQRITLPALLKLPLISFDPALRRLIFGAPAEAGR